VLTNGQLSELLALAAESDDELAPHARRAYKKAARSALSWPVAAADLKARGQPLTELRSIGPYLSYQLSRWLANPPEVPAPPPSRLGFLTLVEVKEALLGAPSPCGDLHVHTSWSDGTASLMEMAEAAEERGYKWLSITDHAKNLKIARGLDEERLAAQGEEIGACNRELAQRGFRVRLLRSSEINFDPQGRPDYSAEILEGLDFAIGAFHSKLRLTEDQTGRYLAALECPQVDVLAHPRGRIFNHRLGLSADWDEVCRHASRLGKALEVDGIPDRQDLSVDILTLAARHDTWISLGSDAHGVGQLHFLDYALAAALRAGIRPERILNLLTLDELLEWRQNRLQQAMATR
jgi:histidinol phosphatase-like PHP family hydrolase